MPNWCRNQLTVAGDPSEVAAFATAAASEGMAFSFRALRPMPPLPDHEPSTWSVLLALTDPERLDPSRLTQHIWALVNWGTTRDADDVQLFAEGKEALRYDFVTVYSPPLPLVTWLAKTYSALCFHLAYYEPNVLFAGQQKISGPAVEASQGEGEEQVLGALAGSPLALELHRLLDESGRCPDHC